MDRTAGDQLPSDLLPSDLLLSDQIPGRPPCTQTYGATNGFMLCSQTATECMFYYKNGSCDAVCKAGGGTCIKSAEDTNNTCTPKVTTSCTEIFGDALCTCTR